MHVDKIISLIQAMKKGLLWNAAVTGEILEEILKWKEEGCTEKDVISGGSRGVSLVSTETPFQIGINFYYSIMHY